MASLSVQRVQLSRDPDDWVWVRWYRPRPTARVMPFPTLGGFDLWQDYKENPPTGPHVEMIGGAYRPEVPSPFPGLDFEGTAEQWQEGLPPGPRAVPDVGVQCGAEFWTVDLPVPVGVLPTEPDEVVLVRGGGSGGGPVPMSNVPPIAVRGGGSGGGPIRMAAPCLLWFGACDHVAGGGAGGGPVSFARLPIIPVGGGGAGGGPLEMAPLVCGAVPTVVGADRQAYAITNTVELLFDVAIAAGDTVVLAIWHGNPVVGFDWPDPWIPLATLAVGGISHSLEVAYLVWDAGLGAGFDVVWGSAVEAAAYMVTVRGAGPAAPSGTTGATGASSSTTSVDVGLCPALVLPVFGVVTHTGNFFTVAPVDFQGAGFSPAPVVIGNVSPVGPGASATYSVINPASTPWGAVLVVCPPI